MILQRLNETLFFFWHHLTDLLWRLLPLLPLLLLANYRLLVVHGGDPAEAAGDPLLLLAQLLAGVLATALAVRYALAVIRQEERGPGRLWGDAINRSLALAAVQVLAGLAVLAGLCLLVLPGIYLLGVLLPAYVIVIAEDLSAPAALQAAWQRFRPWSWRVALAALLLFAGIFVVLAGLEALGRLLSAAPLALRVMADSLLDLIGLLFAQLVAILLVRVYELERREAAAER